jgi:hypothetical protein
MIDWLIERAKRTPYFDLTGYMNRWWLVPVGEPAYGEGCGPVSFHKRPIAWLFQKCGIAVRIHEILRSDFGRHAHNHPWPFISIILKGNGYMEEVFDDEGHILSVKTYRPGSILFRPARTWHRLTLVDGPVVTMFITGRKTQTWGFNVDGTFTPHWEYHDEP